MKRLIFLFIFFCFPVMALTYRDQAANFENYKNITRFNLQLKNTQRFYTSAFRPFELIDQVFEGQNFNIKVATGRELIEKENLEKFIGMDNYTLYHFKADQLSVAVQFQGLSETQMQEYLRDIKNFYTKKFSLIDFVLPSVHAGCNENAFATPDQSLATIEKPMTVIEKNIFFSQMKSCVMNTLSSIEAKADGFGEGFMNFISSPVKSVEKFWDTTKQVYLGVKEVILNMEQSFDNLKQMLSGLSLSSLVDVSCQLAGDSIADSIQNFLTSGPLGFAKTAMAIAGKIALIGKVSKAMALFAKMKLSDSEMGALVKKMLNPKNERKLKDLEEIADLKMQNLAKEYAQCML